MNRPAFDNCWRRAPVLCFLVSIGVLLNFSCDSVEIRKAKSPHASGPSEPSPVGLGLTESALNQLYQIRYRNGLEFGYPAAETTYQNQTIAVGPVKGVSVDADWELETRSDEVVAKVSSQDLEFRIPVRFTNSFETRVCKLTIGLDTASARGSLKPVNTADELLLASNQEPTITVRGFEFSQQGSRCPRSKIEILKNHRRTFLRDFVQNAWTQSVQQAARLNLLFPFSFFGNATVLDQTLTFANRIGRLKLLPRIQAEQVTLDKQGIKLTIGMRTSVEGASCSPNARIIPRSDGQFQGSTDLGTLSNDSQHVGIEISVQFIRQLLSDAIASGFSCRGMETLLDPSSPTPKYSASVLELSELGFRSGFASTDVYPVFQPRTHPTLSIEQGVLQIDWEALGLELYSYRRGVPVTLGRLQADLEMAYEVSRDSSTDLRFKPSDIEVSEASFASKWLEQIPKPRLRDWAQRVFSILLDDGISIPIGFGSIQFAQLTDVNLNENSVSLTLRLRTTN